MIAIVASVACLEVLQWSSSACGFAQVFELEQRMQQPATENVGGLVEPHGDDEESKAIDSQFNETQQTMLNQLADVTSNLKSKQVNTHAPYEFC